MLRKTVLFQGYDASGNYGLWETNGTAAGTSELTGIVNGVFNPTDFTVFNGEVLFQGEDANSQYGLWVTNGTAAGTTEVGGFGSAGVSGANSNGLFFEARPIGGPGWAYPNFAMFNGEVLFDGIDANNFGGLWVTDGRRNTRDHGHHWSLYGRSGPAGQSQV